MPNSKVKQNLSRNAKPRATNRIFDCESGYPTAACTCCITTGSHLQTMASTVLILPESRSRCAPVWHHSQDCRRTTPPTAVSCDYKSSPMELRTGGQSSGRCFLPTAGEL